MFSLVLYIVVMVLVTRSLQTVTCLKLAIETQERRQ